MFRITWVTEKAAEPCTRGRINERKKRQEYFSETRDRHNEWKKRQEYLSETGAGMRKKRFKRCYCKTSLLPFRLWVVFRLETSFAANPKDLLTLLYVGMGMHTPSRGTCWAAPIPSFPEAWTLIPNRCIVIVTFIFPLAPPPFPREHEREGGRGESRKGIPLKSTLFSL